MDRPTTANPATARDIILEIVRNMREGLEPLHYSHAGSVDLPRLPASRRHGAPARHPAAHRGRGAPRAGCGTGNAEPRIARRTAEAGAAGRAKDRGARRRVADPHSGEHRRRRGAGRYRDLFGAGAAGQGRTGRGLDDQADRHAPDGRRGVHQTELRSRRRRRRPRMPARSPSSSTKTARATRPTA